MTFFEISVEEELQSAERDAILSEFEEILAKRGYSLNDSSAYNEED